MYQSIFFVCFVQKIYVSPHNKGQDDSATCLEQLEIAAGKMIGQ